MPNSQIPLHKDVLQAQTPMAQGIKAEQETEQEAVVTLEDAVAGYNKPVTPSLTMTLRRGEVVGLTGDNGIGKSTFIRLLTRAGAHCFQGRMTLLADIKFAVLEQQPPALLRHIPFNGRELVQLYAGIDNADAEVPDWALPHLHKRVSVLSGGQLQILLLCACLVRGRDLLILDEPTHSLDARGLAYLAQRLSERAPQLAVLVVSHEMDFLRSIGARVVRLAAS